jgi:hypothetical protein
MQKIIRRRGLEQRAIVNNSPEGLDPNFTNLHEL